MKCALYFVEQVMKKSDGVAARPNAQFNDVHFLRRRCVQHVFSRLRFQRNRVAVVIQLTRKEYPLTIARGSIRREIAVNGPEAGLRHAKQHRIVGDVTSVAR